MIRKFWKWGPGLAGIALVLVAGCGPHASGHAPRLVDEGPAVAVATIALTAGDAGSAIVLPARVESRSEVTLEARVSGRLTRLMRREGESFHGGATLAEFAAPEAAAALAAARARLAAAIVADERASRQEARFDSLYGRGVVALRELEVAQTAARAAGAERAAATAELERWASGTRLVAPFDGVVVRRHADPGSDVGAGAPILTLRSNAVGEIAVDVPESWSNALEGATVAVAPGDGAWREARITRAEGMIDASSRSRRIYVTPRDGTPAHEAGAFARVRITGRIAGDSTAAAPTPVLVPARALLGRGALDGVYVVENGRARLRWIRLGPAVNGEVEVAAGLAPGDTVVLVPHLVRDGRRVRTAS